MEIIPIQQKVPNLWVRDFEYPYSVSSRDRVEEGARSGGLSGGS